MSIQLGPKEVQFIARLSYEKISVISKQQIEAFFGDSMQISQIIYQLKKKNILKPISKGVYFYSPIETGPKGTRINEFLIAPILFPKGNYYIGYSNIYNYYGFTEQIFQSFYILNTTRQKERLICDIAFKLIKISPNKLYGLTSITVEGTEVVVSDRERTLIDLIYFPNPVGGIKKATEILQNEVTSGKSNLSKIIKYAASFPSISTQKRIGYILDSIGIKNAYLATLANKIKQTSLITLYGSKSRKGKIDNKWGVIVDAA